MTLANDVSAGRRVLMIGLDAADPNLIEHWMDVGALPALATLRRRGLYSRLRTSAKYIAGSPWPTFYTSQPPSQHGLYADFQWRHERLEFTAPNLEWLPLGAFWRHLDGELDVIAYDVPFQLGCQPFHGLELTNWATHDKLFPPSAHPAPLLDEVREKFGTWHVSHEAYGQSEISDLLALRAEMLENTRRSTELALWLLQRPWRLAIICFSALHRGGHRLFDRTSIKGEVPEEEGAMFDAAMRDLYVAADRAVAQLMAAAEGATVIVFSLHGMEGNVDRVDLLDGMLARVLSGGAESKRQVSLARRAGEALPLDWLRFVAKNIPGPLRNRAMTLWQAGGIRWESTLAFTCRADLQGYIRLNLQGRERRGTVAPGPERDVLCGRIAEGLASFRDADTGEPIVKEVRQVDDVFPTGERRDRLPDLLVRWQDAPGASHRLVRSDRFGSVARATPGRIPSGRSGNHRGEGMMLACGEAIPAGITTSSQPHIMDLAPTILQLLGSRCGLPLSGRYIPEFAGVEMARPV